MLFFPSSWWLVRSSLQAQSSRRCKDQTSHPHISRRSVCAVTHHVRLMMMMMAGWPLSLFPTGTCINNTSVMMFKKGSFEIGGTIYPVAIKVAKPQTTEQLKFKPTGCQTLTSSFVSMCLSTTLASETLSGTAANTTWWATCYAWWPAGPSSSTCGTSLPWPYRYNSISQTPQSLSAPTQTETLNICVKGFIFLTDSPEMTHPQPQNIISWCHVTICTVVDQTFDRGCDHVIISSFHDSVNVLKSSVVITENKYK